MASLAVIVPVYNEERVLHRLLERLRAVLDALPVPAVVRLVDDGSCDGTLIQLRASAARDRRFGFLSFSRNFGHQTAVLAGLRETDADVYVVIDGDLQDPPELIPHMLEQWRAGSEVVYCVRRTRREGWLKRAAYRAFYRVLRSVSYLDMPLDTGDFCLMDRRVVDVLRRMPEHNPFVRGQRAWTGFRQTPLFYDRAARAAGEPKYTVRKLLRLAGDGLISFSFAPLRLATRLGVGLLLAGTAALLGLLAYSGLSGTLAAGLAWLGAALAVLSGLNLAFLGVLGEYVGRIFDEVKGRPLYVIREKCDATGAASADRQVPAAAARFVVAEPPAESRRAPAGVGA